MQADVVLGLRVLHPAGNRKSADTLDSILSIGNLKTHPHGDTPTPSKPHLLIVPLPERLWGPNTFKLPLTLFHTAIQAPMFLPTSVPVTFRTPEPMWDPLCPGSK